jgi:hypothetical protein
LDGGKFIGVSRGKPCGNLGKTSSNNGRVVRATIDVERVNHLEPPPVGNTKRVTSPTTLPWSLHCATNTVSDGGCSVVTTIMEIVHESPVTLTVRPSLEVHKRDDDPDLLTMVARRAMLSPSLQHRAAV